MFDLTTKFMNHHPIIVLPLTTFYFQMDYIDHAGAEFHINFDGDEPYYRGFNGDGEVPEDFPEPSEFIRAHDMFFHPICFLPQKPSKKAKTKDDEAEEIRERKRRPRPLKPVPFVRPDPNYQGYVAGRFLVDPPVVRGNPRWQTVARSYSMLEAMKSCPDPFPWFKSFNFQKGSRKPVPIEPLEIAVSYKKGEKQTTWPWRTEKDPYSLESVPADPPRVDSSDDDEDTPVPREVTCFKCLQPGHTRQQCANPKKKPENKTGPKKNRRSNKSRQWYANRKSEVNRSGVF